MKFKLLSDLHLEFCDRKRYGLKDQPYFKPTPTDEDKDTVLLLPGDIHTGMKAQPWLEDMCKQFKHVVYVLGNHEFYGNEWYKVKDYWAKVDVADNFTFLDDGVLFLDDVRVIGGTLWTAVRGQTDNYAFTVWNGSQRMTDYKVTKINHKRTGNYRKLHPGDTIEAHYDTVNYLKFILETPWDGKTIVMTHHLPHNKCIQPQWEGSDLNAFFVTDLDYIINNFNINVWVHGHTHDNIDINVHGTRILCNPMGYHGVALNQDFNEGLVFDC